MRKNLVVASVMLFTFNIGGVLAASSEDSVNHNQASIRETPITRTQVIQSRAELWTLEPHEYESYLELMDGPLGKWNPDIDPLMALGMFATNRQDERRFAELYAQQEFEITQRVLSFQRAYRVAFELLYPHVGMLDQRLLAPYFEHELLRSESQQATREAQQLFVENDRLLIFVPLSCGRCLSTISHLMGMLSEANNAGVDVYVRGADSDEAVSQWAVEHNIQSQWLNQQTLTLNRDEGLFSRLESKTIIAGSTVLPIFLFRNDAYFQLKPQDLGL